MRRLSLLVLAMGSLIAASGCSLFGHESPDPFLAEGFRPLFNGTDLTGWKLTGQDKSWSVEDGAIVCNPQGGSAAYLYTEGQYSDFILQVEYKVKREGGNSGVFFRCNNMKSFPGSGFEVQILGDYDSQEHTWHNAGALYGTVAPPANYSNPVGEWNRYTILVFDRNIVVHMNGNLLYHMNIDDPEINATVLKLSRKDLVPKNRKHSLGHISLQNHGDWVAFRNLRIKEIKREDNQ